MIKYVLCSGLIIEFIYYEKEVIMNNNKLMWIMIWCAMMSVMTVPYIASSKSIFVAGSILLLSSIIGSIVKTTLDKRLENTK